MARITIPEGEGGDAVQLWTLRPEMGNAINRLVDAAYNKSMLPVRVREAARMRDRPAERLSRSASHSGPPRSRSRGSPKTSTPTSPITTSDRSYSDRSLAIAYAERFAIDHLAIDDAFFERLRAVFTDAEILDLTICLAAFLGLGRLLRVLGIDETSLIDV
jgi:alkylhydroperoxidase family enzyme